MFFFPGLVPKQEGQIPTQREERLRGGRPKLCPPTGPLQAGGTGAGGGQESPHRARGAAPGP